MLSYQRVRDEWKDRKHEFLLIRIFLKINFDKRLWTVRSFYHSRYNNREKQVDTSITGREISGLSVIIMDIRS